MEIQHDMRHNQTDDGRYEEAVETKMWDDCDDYTRDWEWNE